MSREYDKLVRDKIPAIINENDETPLTHIAGTEEYGQRLLDKLDEEVAEYRESQEIDELADILEVVHAIRKYEAISKAQLEHVCSSKAEKRGRFDDQIVLERVES